MSEKQKVLKSLVRTSRMVWWGVLLQESLFCMWGVHLFISGPITEQTVLAPYFIFAFLALASFFYGYKFFAISSRLRQTELRLMEFKKRKEQLLLFTVIQFLLLEFVGILGILLAVFLQDMYAVYPFFILSVIGLGRSFPGMHWYEPFFNEDEKANEH